MCVCVGQTVLKGHLQSNNILRGTQTSDYYTNNPSFFNSFWDN